MTAAHDPRHVDHRHQHYAADKRREQAVARAGAYLARWADGDPQDTRALERAERALREALESM